MQNLIDYVNGFRHRPYIAGQMAKCKLKKSQKKMKSLFDRKAKQRQFSHGDQVMVPLPVVGSPFRTDFRKVNSVTKPDLFPLPRMEDCVDQVGSVKFVSKFDLLKGYWQVPLSPRAQEISAFITTTGLYSYKVMPWPPSSG